MTIKAVVALDRKTQLSQIRDDEIALQSLQALAKSYHSRDEGPLTTVTAAKIPAAIRAINRLLMPVSAEALAIEIARLFIWARTFNVPVPDAQSAAEEYSSGLKHLPIDLIQAGFRAIKATYHYGNRLPFPADIARHVSEAYYERCRTLLNLQSMSRMAVDDPKPLTAEERATGVKLLGDLSRDLRANTSGMQDNPRSTPDDMRERNERMRARLKPPSEEGATQ